jgi:hypothetical protein
MHVLIPSCCFCGKVRDDERSEFGRGLWVDVETYRARHEVVSEDMWFAPTYCRDCMAKRSFDRAQNVP